MKLGYGQDAVYAQGPLTAFNDNGNGTVTDLNTGLIWQKDDDGTTRFWSVAKSYCENLEIGGHTDWRLPSRRELLLLVSFGHLSPAINHDYFPGCHNDWYWSSTRAPTSTAYRILFAEGGADGLVMTEGYETHLCYARCVRGPSPPQRTYVDNQDGTVSDLSTGIMWQKGNSEVMDRWENQLAYCANLRLEGYSDWRLPNIRELETLVDDTRHDPAIDPIFGGLLGELTSSTSLVSHPHSVFVVSTENGSVHFRQKQNLRHVRCARLGPEGDYWDRLDFYINFGLNSVYFLNTNYGWCVGEQGKILATQDGGDSWSPQSIGRSTSLQAVIFADMQNGWLLENITGYNGVGRIHHTNNGGSSWSQQYQGSAYTYLYGLSFLNENRGWVVGSKGVILYTDDGGVSWVSQTSNTTAQLNSVQFVDATPAGLLGTMVSFCTQLMVAVPGPSR